MSRWHTTEFDLLPERAFQPRGWKGGGMTLEGGGKGSAPAPDPRMGQAALDQIELNKRIYEDYRNNDAPWMRELANRAIGISEGSAGLARDQFDFSRGVANEQLGMAREQLGLTRSALERANALSDYQLEQMRFNDNRYRTVGIPFEDQLLSDVNRYDSAGYKQGQINAARADVQESFDNAQRQGLRSMMRRGVNPNSYSFASAASGGDLARATAMASAANKTRMAADQVGLSTKMQMYGGMKGLAGLGATNAGLANSAIGAGTGAIGAGMGAMNAGVGAMGIGNSAIGGMQSGAGSMMGAGSGYLNANNAALGGFNSGMSAGISGFGNYSNLGIQASQVNQANDPFNLMLGAAAGVGTQYALKKFS